jgi:hypothetical protein
MHVIQDKELTRECISPLQLAPAVERGRGTVKTKFLELGTALPTSVKSDQNSHDNTEPE